MRNPLTSNCAMRNMVLAASLLSCAVTAAAQSPITYRYFFDPAGQFVRAVDSTGVSVQLTYDASGNVTNITRTAVSSALSIFSFSPAKGGPGATVAIQGQGFSPVVANNAVTFNGVPATITGATATTLIATVPPSATTGAIAVTAGGSTATSATNFTVLTIPQITAISARYLLAGQNGATVTLTGVNLNGAAFSIQPPTSPAAITISNTVTSANSATLTLNAAALSAIGTIVATNSAGSSTLVPGTANSISVLLPDLDSDNDGLSNAAEIQAGTDPLNPDSDGDGMWDGWELKYGLNPLDPRDAAKLSKAADGLTNLQEFLTGADPTNTDRSVPSVTSISPANNATGLAVNSAVIVSFNTPVLTAAQAAALAMFNPNVTQPVISVSNSAGRVAGTVVTSLNGLTFTPSQNLTISTTYTISVSGFRTNTAGVAQTGTFTSTFTTGSQPDINAPTVIRTSPSYDWYNYIPVNAPVSIEFSKAMDPATINSTSFQVNQGLTVLAGRYQLDSTGKIATFYPASPLPTNAYIYVSLNQHLVADTAGNLLATAFSFAFDTGLRADTTPPAVLTTNPFNGDTGLPVNVQIMIRFTEPVNEISAVHGISITNNGSPIPGSFTFTDSQGSQGTPDFHFLMFVPTNPLYPAGVTSVSVNNVTDIVGNALPNSTWSFTVDSPEELSGPSLIAYSPRGSSLTGLNPVLQIRMSERINPVIVNTFAVSGPGAPGNTQYWPGTVTVAPDRLTASYTFPQPPQPNSRYCWEVPVVNLAGLLGGMSGDCFTTGGAADTTPPVVTGVNPPAGTSNIPLNAVIAAQSSKPLSPVSFANHATGSITLTAGSVPVPGTASLSTDGLTLTFVPTTQLSPGVTYTLAVSTIADYEGNALTPFTSTFTTGIAADTDALSITSFAPADGATAVPVNSQIVISFNKLIDPITVNSTSIAVASPSKGVAVGGTYTVDNSGAFGIVTFKPTVPFAGSTGISIIVEGVQDFAGNFTAGNASFTTAAFADTTPPVVTSVTPTSGASGLGPATLVSLTFSKPLNPSTVNANTFALFNGNARIQAGISSSQDFQTVTLIAGIPPSATISITATHDVQDLAGNALGDYTSVFTSAPTPDVSSPSIVGQRPGFGNSGVPLNAPIVLFASKPLNPSTVTAAITVTQNYRPVIGTVSLSGNNQAITFTPSAPWAGGSTVQIFVDSTATDTSGNPMTVYQGSFNTAPDLTTVGPTVTASLPTPNAARVSLNPVIEIQFSKALDSTSLGGNISLGSLPGNVAVAATVSLADSRTIRISPAALLLASTQYQVTVSAGIRDTAGLSTVYANNYFFFTGTASDNAQPRVAAITPPDSSANIGTNAPIEVRFNKPVNPLTVTTSTVQITAGGNPLSLASVNMVGTTSQDFQIVPFGLLPDASNVTVAVSGVQDLSGNLVVAATAAFTTRTGFDLTRPQIVSSSPFSGATDVPLNSPFTFQFDKPIDPFTVTSANIVISDESTSQPVAGTLSLSSNALQISFAPAASLAVGRDYYVSVGNGVHDLLGNPAGYSTIVTTGFSASTATPHVVLTNPENGFSSVPTNAVIQVLFDEPLQTSSLASVALMADGSAVPGTLYTLSSGNTIVTMTPPALMLAGTSYSINIAGVADLAGHTIAQPYTSSFTTAAGVRLVPTTYVANPPDGTVNVGTNAIPSIFASYRLDPISVDSSTLLLFSHDLNSAITGVVAPSADRLSATYTPLLPLRADTSYCLEIVGITDEAGSAITGQNGSCFTTAAAPDTTSPAVILVSPPDKSANVPVNAIVSLRASKPLNPGTVTGANIVLKTGNSVVAGKLAIASDFETITFTPSASLTAGASYTLTVSGVTDVDGNPIAPFTSGFQTSSNATPLTSQPTVVSTSPVDASTGVPNNSTISVTFDRPMNPVSANAATIAVTANGIQMGGAYAVTGATIIFTPATPLPANATVVVTIGGVLDLSGNTAAQTMFSFTAASTADTTQPVVTSITPLPGATALGIQAAVTATFSKSIDPSTIGNSTFALFAGATRLALNALTWSQDNTSVSFNANPLPGGSTITIVITHGVLDLSGNPLQDFSSSFTTAPVDNNRPQVTLMRPGYGSTVVPAGSPVVLFFSAPMDPSSTQAAITVSQNGAIVTGTSVLTSGGQALTFTPSVPFAPAALVQVFIGSAALSRSGNMLYPSVASFTIAPDLTNTPPVATGASPGQQGSAPPLNSIVQVRFSKPLDPSTVSSSALTLTQLGANNALTGIVSLVGTSTIQMIPSAALKPSTYYYIQVPITVKDSTGLNLAAPFVTNFFTGTSPATSQPRVVAVTPPDTSTGVGENAPLHLRFSENINTLTANAATIQLAVSGKAIAPVDFAYGYSQDVTVTPFATLPDSTKITVTVSGVQDEAGNSVIPFTSTFTTGAAPILSGGAIAITPLGGAVNVPVNAVITVQTNDPVDPSSVSATAFPVTDATSGTPVTGTYSISASGKVITFAPSSPLSAGDTISFYVNLLDMEGNGLGGGGAFTTSNAAVTTPPSVLLVNPPNGFNSVPTDIVPQVLFSEPINTATIGAITLSSGGTTLKTTTFGSNGNQTISLIPPGLLQPSTLYTITVGAVSDTSGNTIATPQIFTFTTGAGASLANPYVSSLFPAGATDAALSTVVSVAFSAPLNPLTVAPTAFQMTDPSSAVVPGALALSPDGLTVTFTPAAALMANSTYQITINNIADLAGNTVIGTQTVFTTGAQ